ncbi:MAG: 4-aminobutyrate aminotransferase GabT [Syntrophorhabdus sp. PtaB.Bin184]|nr:MAG: 4-aminobutyrate aminotransferase GabT [Syntrophorhabdus sp. PtaB.Bin184]
MAGSRFSLVPEDVPKVDTKYRRIATMIPVPESVPVFEDLERFESISMHGQLPVFWDRAEGFQVYDAWGNKWLDFSSTIFVTNAGHGNERIRDAIRSVVDRPLLHTYTYASRERVNYIKYLIDNTPDQFEKAFLLSAGTEATECGMKLMRMHGFKEGKKRPGIIGFEGNWHGRTMGAQMMSYNPAQKEWIGYLDPNIYHLPFPYPWRPKAVEDPERYFYDNIDDLMRTQGLSADDDLCGFMIETFQGWSAAFYPPPFVKALERFARDHGMLIAFDEMQAGFGRTGQLFGYMHYGVEPDILCCGKGASSSLPLSIVLGRREIMDLPEIGSMSSTHSANPMVCAAGLANMRYILEEGLIERSRVLGELFHERLNGIKERFSGVINYVLGTGLLAALHFNDGDGNPLADLATRVSEKAMKKGLLVVHTGRETIKLAPPLTITEEALLEGIDVLTETISECVGER